ncbi:tail fiber domain-containing protein [Sphingomonas aerolata]|uniref:tail fiber domain-containing protein n=1 Tax=Sphingomonas aerolata TaxID=185951 RepID=UPI002FE24827
MAATSSPTTVDLSRFDPPTIVEQLDYEKIFQRKVARVQALLPSFDATIDSDPAVKVLQVATYDEILLRADFNERLQKSMVAYAASPEISTSDKRQKTEIGDIPDLLLDAWGDVCWSRFKFTDGRRWHFGLIAQDVYAALKKRGVDPFDLAPVCLDEWAEETGPTMQEVEVEKSYEKIVLDPNGNREQKTTLPQIGNDGELVLKPVTVRYRIEIEKKTVTQLEDTGVSQVTRPAGDLWGLRYVECLALEAAWQRREIARMRQRGDALEARLLALEKAA